MENQKRPDLSQVSPELKQKMLEWEQQKPEYKQLTVLEDVADMLQTIIEDADDSRKANNKTVAEMGSLITDIRESLIAIKEKEDPETPDWSKPIVDALGKINFNPTIQVDAPKIPEIKAPEVKIPKIAVPETVVNVDTKSIKDAISREIPKAFKEAIALIPKVEIPEYPDRWDEVLEWLESIDTASRLKPQFPTELKVTNPDGTDITFSAGKDFDYIGIADTSATVDTLTFKTGGSGGTTVRTLAITFASGATKISDDLVSLEYS